MHVVKRREKKTLQKCNLTSDTATVGTGRSTGRRAIKDNEVHRV